MAGLTQNLIRQFHPISGHGVLTDHGSQTHGPLVAALVAFHSHRLHRDEAGIGLPSLIIPTVLVKLSDEDGVRFLNNTNAIPVHDSGTAHGQARALGKDGD